MKCLPAACVQTVFKMRRFYKALNQQWSHVLTEGEKGRSILSVASCQVCKTSQYRHKLHPNIQG